MFGFYCILLYLCVCPLLHSLLSPQGLMLLLQNLPTSSWSDTEISLLVAEAFRLMYTFADAPNHLQAPRK